MAASKPEGSAFMIKKRSLAEIS
eukprot:gene16021-biopygen17130